MKFLYSILIFNLIFCGPPRPEKPVIQSTEEKMKPIEEIVKDLDSQNFYERTQAIVELSSRNHRDSIPKIRKLLKEDKNPSVNETAAIALGEFKDKESTQSILYLLKRKDIQPGNILDALTRMGDKSAATEVVKYLDSEDLGIRLQAVEALSTFGEKSVSGQILGLARKNKDVEKSKTYAMVLGKLGVKDAEDYLISLAKETEPSPTLAAAYLALGRIKSKKSIPILTDAIGKDFPKGRDNAGEALANIKDPSSIPALLEYFTHHQKEIRYIAGSTVVEIPSTDSARKVLSILKTGNKTSIGVSSFVLGRLKFKEARKDIENFLLKEDTPEREEIAKSLGWIGEKESIPLLRQVLKEKSGEGRYGAAWSLGALEANEAIEDLIVTAESGDKRLSILSIEALGMMKDSKVIPFLEKKLKKDKTLSSFVFQSMQGIPGEEARQTLIKYSASDVPEIALPAIEAIGKRKEKSSVKDLILLLEKNESPKIKIIYLALTTITGEKFISSSEWKNWYEKNK